MIKIDSVRRIISKRLGEPDYLMMDIVAPLYWWDSFNYVIDNHFGNGVTLMRRLPINPFDLSDFSCEELLDEKINCDNHMLGIFGSTQEFDTSSKAILLSLCDVLNYYRVKAIETRDSKYIRQIVTLIPYSYNQRCTISFTKHSLTRVYDHAKQATDSDWLTFYTLLTDLNKCKEFLL